MLLSEPPRSPGDLHFRLLGIPVRVHLSFWLVTAVLGLRDDLAAWIMWIVAVLVSILIHELGHAGVMRAYGFLPWITLYGFGGLTSYNPALRYRSRGADTLGQVLISLAGPCAGFAFAALLAAVLFFFRVPLRIFWASLVPWVVAGVRSTALRTFLDDLFYVSIVWGAVNLLPMYPLDGGQILRELLVRGHPQRGIRLSLRISVVLAIAMAVYGVVAAKNLYLTLFFGVLAYSSYQALQSYETYGMRE